jgi:multidrug transporter EmrE-like cation transporter
MHVHGNGVRARSYFLIISVEMAYGKHIVGPHLTFASMWGPTLYTNTISIPPMVTIGLLTGEPLKLLHSEVTPLSCALLLISCVIGVAISYLGWRARSLVTATCYTVLGVANKMLTVLANAMVWDQHASITGLFFLCVCLVGAVGYKQAPERERPAPDADSAPSTPKRACTSRRLCMGLAALLLGGMSVGVLLRASPPPPPAQSPLVPPAAAPYAAPYAAHERPSSAAAKAGAHGGSAKAGAHGGSAKAGAHGGGMREAKHGGGHGSVHADARSSPVDALHSRGTRVHSRGRNHTHL